MAAHGVACISQQLPCIHVKCVDLACAGAMAERARLLAESGNPTPALPFGVTLIGAAWRDEALWAVAAELHARSGLGCGPAEHGVKPYRTS